MSFLPAYQRPCGEWRAPEKSEAALFRALDVRVGNRVEVAVEAAVVGDVSELAIGGHFEYREEEPREPVPTILKVAGQRWRRNSPVSRDEKLGEGDWAKAAADGAEGHKRESPAPAEVATEFPTDFIHEFPPALKMRNVARDRGSGGKGDNLLRAAE